VHAHSAIAQQRAEGAISRIGIHGECTSEIARVALDARLQPGMVDGLMLGCAPKSSFELRALSLELG
jgi:hypothetical protein